jgi:hypothetical protein
MGSFLLAAQQASTFWRRRGSGSPLMESQVTGSLRVWYSQMFRLNFFRIFSMKAMVSGKR